ncbi:MAG: hypothetical protein FWD60_10400 [Candidatus Azobacteroides sp.]|nr:hypothetical protein [Candidatus Azobacteroides sp.]
MLAKTFSTSFSTNRTPNFTYSHKLENIFEAALVETVPEFLYGLVTYSKTRRLDESGFSQEFVTALNRCLCNDPKGILAISEYRDYYTIGANPVKRVDIAFVSSEQGASIKKLYTVEAKRLPTGSGERENEYVYGFFNSGSPSGGIQRFKTGDHGFRLSKSGLLGYIEANDCFYWYNTINKWIQDKVKKLPEEWKDDEQLKEFEYDITHNYSISRSIAYRSTDSIELFHLWIKIPTKN